MTITDNSELIINIDGRTKLITKDQIISAFAEPKASCANYERDNFDPVVEGVRQKLLDRSQVGIKKYTTTLKGNTKDNYLAHAQMEAMDLANYLETLLQQEKDITQIVKDEPNDMILGRKIRSIYGS